MEDADAGEEYVAVAPRLGVLVAVDAGGCVHLRTSDLLALAQLQPGSWQPPAAAGGSAMPAQPLKVRQGTGCAPTVFECQKFCTGSGCGQNSKKEGALMCRGPWRLS